jgi:diphthine-ammonia ligase
MKLGVLYSGGKDSTLAALIAKNEGHELVCLISIFSSNTESYMFHTPSIEKTKIQAEAMGVPLIIQETKGKKEEELKDLRKAILKAKEEHSIEGIVTGAIASQYQASRIQKICDELGLVCINPLWGKDQKGVLEELVAKDFKVIIVGVFAYPLDQTFLGRVIDSEFISEMSALEEKYKINIAGEGGEFETFVLNCPLFFKSLRVVGLRDSGEKHSWRREIEVE